MRALPGLCPAYSSGLQLSPKLLMMNLRDNLMERGVALSATGSDNGVLKKELIGDVITEEDDLGLRHLLRLRPGVPAVH